MFSTHFQRLSRTGTRDPKVRVHVFQAGNDKPLILGTKGGAKTAPLQAKFRGSSCWIFVCWFLWGRLDVRETPQRDTWKVFFCWNILVLNYQFFSKWTPWSCMGLLQLHFWYLWWHINSTLVAGEFPPFLGDSKMGEQKLLGKPAPNKEQLKMGWNIPSSPWIFGHV